MSQKPPSLQNDVEKFLYTHAQTMPFKKLLMAIIKTWEDAYLARIAELEKQDNAGNQMDTDGGGYYRGHRYEDID